MIEYQGITKIDKPNGAGSFVRDNQDGGEVCNFLPVNGKLYGFARIRKGNDLRIQRLGASKEDDFMDNVTVVFFATDPLFGGQYVVGWYDNARLYRSVQLLAPSTRKGHPWYVAVSAKSKGKLLPLSQRKFAIPVDGPGQTNAWYVSEYADARAYLKIFFKFKANPETYKTRKKPTATGKGTGQGWQLDAEKRKQIEVAAMDATAAYFEEKGYSVTYVHNEKLGWDMEAVKETRKLLLEIKGTSIELGSVILTPNEYFHSSKKTNYRVCILEKALDKSKAQLHICRINYNKKKWISESGEELRINEIKSAQLFKL
jgi:hypothetical protein